MLGWSQIRERKMFMPSLCFRAVFWCRSFFIIYAFWNAAIFWLRFHVVTWDVEHLNCLLKDCMESASPFLKYLWWERAYNWSNTKSYFTFFRNSCVLEAFLFSFVQIMQISIYYYYYSELFAENKVAFIKKIMVIKKYLKQWFLLTCDCYFQMSCNFIVKKILKNLQNYFLSHHLCFLKCSYFLLKIPCRWHEMWNI